MKLTGTMGTSFVLTGRFLLELDLGLVNPTNREINEFCEALKNGKAIVIIQKAV
jgi:hypothetical protein